MRKKVINNKYYETFIKFRNAVFDFFESVEEIKLELKSFVGTKLHLFSA